MSLLTRSPVRSERDGARARARGPRRFHPAAPKPNAGEPPVEGQDFGLWPGPDRPGKPEDGHLIWPYWLVLLVPWLTLTVAFVLEHFKVCVMCMPDAVPLP